MNLNLGLLSDPVQAADALFEQFRRERKIEQNEMMRELKISAFAADFRADQNASAVFLGKPRGVAIALDEIQSFVKHAHFEIAHTLAESGFNFIDLGFGAANQENLFGSDGFQETDEPDDTRIVRQIGAWRWIIRVLSRRTSGCRDEIGIIRKFVCKTFEQILVAGWDFEWMKLRHSAW